VAISGAQFHGTRPAVSGEIVGPRYSNCFLKASRKGGPFFLLEGGNDQVIGSSEIYSGRAAMENGIACVKKNAVQASVLDQT
jgi:uncharacterized protein YegP (UPF0339 family)